MADAQGRAQDFYARYYAEKLWAMVPEVYKTPGPNGESPLVLRAVLEAVAERAANTRRDIDRIWENQSIDTCDDDVVAALGALVGARPLAFHDRRAQRVDVAKTIAYRRRRGTPSLLAQLVRDLADWDVVLVEAFRRLARARHGLDPVPAARIGRLSGTPQGGTADLRSVFAGQLAATAFDEYAHTVDVRRARGQSGRYHPQKLQFHVYTLRVHALHDVDPVAFDTPNGIVFTLDPSGRDVPLFARGRVVSAEACQPWQPGAHERNRQREPSAELPLPWQVRAPILCRALGHAEYELSADQLDDVLGDDTGAAEANALRSLVGVRFRSAARFALRLRDLGGLPPGAPPAYFTRLLERSLLPDSGKAVLYPDSVGLSLRDDAPLDELQRGAQERYYFDRVHVAAGRLDGVREAADPDVVHTFLDPERGRVAFVGAPPSARFVSRYHYGFSADLGAGGYPRRDLPAEGVPLSAGGSHTLDAEHYRVTDSASYAFRVADVARTDFVLAAEDGERPYVLVGGESGPAQFVPEAGAPRKLLLDGIWFGTELESGRMTFGPSDAPALDGFDWDEVVIRRCTLDPGGTAMDGRTIAPLGIVVTGRIKRLVIDRAILASLRVDEGDEETASGHVERIEIHDSILDAQKLDQIALAAPHSEVVLVRSTCFGDVVAETLSASDALVLGLVVSVDVHGGCFRFSAGSSERNARPEHGESGEVLTSRFPRRYQALPARADERFFVEPWFFRSMRFGDPHYAALSEVCPHAVRTGGENGTEMGAFAGQKSGLRRRAIAAKVEEYQPAGLAANFLPET